jgi:signal transduction histidine kinase
MADLASALSRLGIRPGVQVAIPGSAVEVPRATADELVDAVGACLDNVALHVGSEAPSWVLLEAFPDRVEISVRDEGPGIPAGRLREAEAEGRLGVVESIQGRLRDLGGTATLHTGPHGTEWELMAPLEPVRGRPR